MEKSKSADKLRKMIEKAIEDHKITAHEMDMILMVATEDSHVDPEEQALLTQLQEMIENGSVKMSQ